MRGHVCATEELALVGTELQRRSPRGGARRIRATGAGDRDDFTGEGEQPGECDLGGTDLVPGSDSGERLVSGDARRSPRAAER
jgi:hypothetical protein